MIPTVVANAAKKSTGSLGLKPHLCSVRSPCCFMHLHNLNSKRQAPSQVYISARSARRHQRKGWLMQTSTSVTRCRVVFWPGLDFGLGSVHVWPLPWSSVEVP